MKEYASKLLLFGEYTIINGSRALAMPYPAYSGRWTTSDVRDERLLAFAEYLEQQDHLRYILDLTAFRKALDQGLYFESNIPVGYGLGSSGALCAAVYDRFAVASIGRREVDRFAELRRDLALMESHFHGSSSGTDPLICYIGHPVVIRPEGEIELVNLPDTAGMPSPLFLVDTNISRSTGPLVENYLERCKDPDYALRIRDELNPLVNELIDDFLQANWKQVATGMAAVSRFQWTWFRDMIPPDLLPLWEEGMLSGDYYLKLCGAGGGGFLLGIARSEDHIRALNNRQACTKVW